MTSGRGPQAAADGQMRRQVATISLPTWKVGAAGSFSDPSGAGHDAAVFALAGIPSATIFVRNANGSHNPHEALDLDDQMAGTGLLHAAVASPLGDLCRV